MYGRMVPRVGDCVHFRLSLQCFPAIWQARWATSLVFLATSSKICWNGSKAVFRCNGSSTCCIYSTHRISLHIFLPRRHSALVSYYKYTTMTISMNRLQERFIEYYTCKNKHCADSSACMGGWREVLIWLWMMRCWCDVVVERCGCLDMLVCLLRCVDDRCWCGCWEMLMWLVMLLRVLVW